jgi:16S rRNA processing protein RimM
MLVLFEGMDSPEKAGRFRNLPVYVRTVDRPPLPEGQYYHHQLIGLQVVDEKGNDLGQLSELLHTGANDVYVVQTAERTELLLPAINSVVMGIDMAAGKIRVHIPDGLIPEPRIPRRDRGRRKKPNAKPG